MREQAEGAKGFESHEERIERPETALEARTLRCKESHEERIESLTYARKCAESLVNLTKRELKVGGLRHGLCGH